MSTSELRSVTTARLIMEVILVCFDEIKVRFCISEDRRFLVYVMRSGKSWALPFDRDYRQAGVLSLNTIENEKLIHYTKKKGVVKRVILGNKRVENLVLY
ncbi:MAG: hypothetical protein QNK79_04530 [Synechococcus sp. ArSW.bin.68]